MSPSILLSITVPKQSPSHWPQTLGACIVPLPSEVDHIRNIISGAESDLFQLETEVARVQVVLRHLSRQLDETRTKITVHKALLSPIRRLPDELLSEIFIHCLPDQRKMDAKHDSFRIGEAPLLLGSVCGRWRVVSLATQELWSFVRVNFTSHRMEFAAEKAKTWLERAGTRLLSVTLSEGPGFSPIRRIDAIVNLVLSISHRCHHIMLDVPHDIHAALLPMKGCLPSLSSVTLSQFYGNTFETAPNLRKVRMAHDSILSRRCNLSLPYSQLTECIFTYISSPECIGILENCPNLISYTLQQVLGETLTSFLPLRHARLLNLHIPGDVGTLFNFLILPALRSVHLSRCASSQRGWSKLEFFNLLSESSCVLEKFVWDIKPIHAIDDLLQCLDAMENLKELQILDVPDLSPLLHGLTSDEEGACFCPKLRAIQLYLPAIRDNTALVQFVQSRRSNHNDVARLDCIRFTGGRRDNLPNLDEAQDNGLDVFISD